MTTPNSNYPAALDNYVPLMASAVQPALNNASLHVRYALGGVTAIEATLGVNPQGSFADVATRLADVDASLSSLVFAINGCVLKVGDTMTGSLFLGQNNSPQTLAPNLMVGDGNTGPDLSTRSLVAGSSNNLTAAVNASAIIGNGNSNLTGTMDQSLIVGGSNTIRGSSTGVLLAGFGHNLDGGGQGVMLGSGHTIGPSGQLFLAGGRNLAYYASGSGAIGNGLQLRGANNSFSVGSGNGNWGASNAFMSGGENTILGDQSIIAGSGNRLIASYSAVFGSGNRANAPYVIMAGQGNRIGYAPLNCSVSYPGIYPLAPCIITVSGDYREQFQQGSAIYVYAQPVSDSTYPTRFTRTITSAVTYDGGSGNTSFEIDSEVGNIATAMVVNSNSMNQGDYSAAIGTGNTVLGAYSSVFGSYNFVSKTSWYSFAAGSSNYLYGYNAIALGSANQVFNQGTAIGYSNSAFSALNFAVGQNNQAAGNFAVAMGYNNVTNAPYSLVGGQSSRIGYASTSFTILGNTVSILGDVRSAYPQDSQVMMFYVYGGTTGQPNPSYQASINGPVSFDGVHTTFTIDNAPSDNTAGSMIGFYSPTGYGQSSIVYGKNLTNYAEASALFGRFYTVAESAASSLFAGSDHQLLQAEHSFVVGQNNSQDATSGWTGIVGRDHNLSYYSNYAFVAGHHNTLSGGTGSAVFGQDNNVYTSNNMLVAGQSNQAGNGATATIIAGQSNYNPSGSYNAIFGFGNAVSGSYNGAFGSYNTLGVSASYSFAAGESNQISYLGSMAFGYYNDVQSQRSVVIGVKGTTNAAGQILIGGDGTASNPYLATQWQGDTGVQNHLKVRMKNGFKLVKGSDNYNDDDVTEYGLQQAQLTVNDGPAPAQQVLQQIQTQNYNPLGGQDGVFLIEARVIARRTGGTAGAPGDTAAFIVQARFKTVSGVCTMQGLLQPFTSADSLGVDATLGVDGSNKPVVLVTGAADTSYSWATTTVVQRLF